MRVDFGNRILATLHGAWVALVVGAHPAFATDMTAGVIMERMSASERFIYVSGMIEGLAYSRFLRDSAAAGSKDERGMKCIYDWFYEGDDSIQQSIDSAFRTYADYSPSVVVWAMVKRECGE